jgi:hypothetical protein
MPFSLHTFFTLYFAPWESDNGILQYFNCEDVPQSDLESDVMTFFEGHHHSSLGELISELLGSSKLNLPFRRISNTSALNLKAMLNSLSFID